MTAAEMDLIASTVSISVEAQLTEIRGALARIEEKIDSGAAKPCFLDDLISKIERGKNGDKSKAKSQLTDS